MRGRGLWHFEACEVSVDMELMKPKRVFKTICCQEASEANHKRVELRLKNRLSIISGMRVTAS